MDKTKWHLILIALFIALVLTASASPFRFVQTHKIVTEVNCFVCHKQELEDVFEGRHITRMGPNQTRFFEDYYFLYADGQTSLDWMKDTCYTCHMSYKQYDKFALSDPFTFYNRTANRTEAIYNNTDLWRGGSSIYHIVGSKENTIEVSLRVLDIQPSGKSVNGTIRVNLANFSNHQDQTIFETTQFIYVGEESKLTTTPIYGDYFNVTIILDGQWMTASVIVSINGTSQKLSPLLFNTTGTSGYNLPKDLKDFEYPYFHTQKIYLYQRLDSLWVEFRNKKIANITTYEEIKTSTENGWITKPSCSSEDAMCHVNQKITYIGVTNGLPGVDYGVGFYKHNMPYTTTEQCRICHLNSWVK